jgi:membrane protein DedA with SNARE-associated domain
MTETIHLLVERYGLAAIFLGSLAEGESAAILAGFFAHQHVFEPWRAFLVVFVGAWLGDLSFFLTGRYFSDTRPVLRLRQQTGFARALKLVRDHPAAYVVLSRYAYGLRLAAGVVAGLSEIPFAKFLVLNVVSSLLWAALFCSIGFFLGLGTEQLFGQELHRHHRLLVGLAIGVVAILAAPILSRLVKGVARA